MRLMERQVVVPSSYVEISVDPKEIFLINFAVYYKS